MFSLLSCPILSCLVLSCLVLPCLVLSCFAMSCLVLSCLVLSCLVMCCLVLSCLVLSCHALSCLVPTPKQVHFLKSKPLISMAFRSLSTMSFSRMTTTHERGTDWWPVEGCSTTDIPTSLLWTLLCIIAIVPPNKVIAEESENIPDEECGEKTLEPV